MKRLSLIALLLAGCANSPMPQERGPSGTDDFSSIAVNTKADYGKIADWAQADRSFAAKIAPKESLAQDADFHNNNSCQDRCMDMCENNGGGEQDSPCWKTCTSQSWNDPSQVCASRCGVDNPAGSRSCWNACTKQSWNDPSQVCSSRCGITTRTGAEACWNTCTKQSWNDPSQVCSSRCGAVTPAGSRACWNACTKQSWNDPSQVCSSRCGVNTRDGQQACWDTCTKQSWNDPSQVCSSRCGTR